MLHFTGATLGAGDRVEVVRSGDPDPFHAFDVFTSAHGPSFWSRPVSGNSVVVRFVDGGDGTGQASITEYGRGEGLRLGGADFVNGGNANGDVFMLDPSWDEPTFHNAGGICPSGANPSWENVAVLPAGVMRDTARKVGNDPARGGHASLDLHGDADRARPHPHCGSLPRPGAVASCSFTLDFETDGRATGPLGTPRASTGSRASSAAAFSASPATPPGARLRGSGDRHAGGRAGRRAGGDADVVDLRPGRRSSSSTTRAPRRRRSPAAPPTDGGSGESLQRTRISGRSCRHDCDIDNGSSGSSLFDTAGRIVAINDWAFGPCNGRSLSIIDVQQDFLTAPPPPKDVDVMLVFDRSGSMSLPATPQA